MRFGFGTLLWGRRIDDLDYCLDVIAACGYQGVEFAQHFKHIYIREGSEREGIRPLNCMDELLNKLKERGLSLIGLVGGTLDERRLFLQEYRDCYLYLDRWPAPEKDADFHQQVSRCLEDGITLALHPHWLTPMCRIKQAIDIIEEMNSPHIRLLMDTAHGIIAAENPVEIASNYSANLCGVHIKNWKPDFGRWSHRYAKGFCLPSEDGIVRITDVLDELHQKQFKGWIVLEQDHYVRHREQTALEGARWMEKHGQAWGIDISPKAELIAVDIARNHPNPFLSSDYERQLFQLDWSLKRCVEHQPSGHIFYREVALGLMNCLKVEAVKVWAYNPLSEELTLVGCAGTNNSKSITIKLLTSKLPLVDDILRRPEVCDRYLDDPMVGASFGDVTWLQELKKRSVHWMTVLPLFNTSNSHQLRFIISIFSEDRLLNRSSMLADAQTFPIKLAPGLQQMPACVALEEYGTVIARSADYLTDELCSAASGATNTLCGMYDGDAIDFSNALVEHIQRRLQCNCVTVFLEDATGRYLKPVGRSGEYLVWPAPDGAAQIHKYYEHPSDTGRLTWLAWKGMQMVFSSCAKDGKAREKRQKNDADRDEILYAPLARRESHNSLGVVRLHNKLLPDIYEGEIASMFTDDDAAHLDAIIQTALPYLELLRHREEEKEGVARMVHEFQTPLVAIRAAADFMRRGLRSMGHEPEQVFPQDFLGMVTNWADLMGHLARNAQIFSAGMDTLPPQKRKTDLRKDVILPVLHQIRPMLGKKMRLEFEHEGFDDVPPLWIDSWLFQSVFFNLVSNACKYGAGTEDVRIDLRAVGAGQDIYISVSDWGRGIREEIQELIFEPKFRAPEALASDISGQGLGLHVVRSIINAHGGSIRVTHSHLPTTFEITLPQTLRHAPTAKLK